MKAARLYGPRDLRIESLPDPEPGPGEALIRIDACGVCPSDVRGYVGTRASTGSGPRTPGHEWAGTILALGPAPDEGGYETMGGGGHAAGAAGAGEEHAPPFRVGDRVVADWRYVCGRCYECRRGVFNYCEQLRRHS
jgi:threonine dehydrogenase-like Zn-dependent dehydrogenase